MPFDFVLPSEGQRTVVTRIRPLPVVDRVDMTADLVSLLEAFKAKCTKEGLVIVVNSFDVDFEFVCPVAGVGTLGANV